MESIKNLIARFWPTGFLFVSGLILIIYVAFGFLYLQQGAKQREFEGQIAQIGAVVSRPLAKGGELQAEYEEVNQALAPMTDSDAIKMLVGIAGESGIDISEESGKFRVPSASFSKATVGGGTYQLISFRNIIVQGDFDNVMAFISVLDSGTTLETMVLNRVVTNEAEVPKPGDVARRAEFSQVTGAVTAIVRDNNLSEIPNPLSFDGGVATNRMGDDPGTEGTVEGFPDITTTATEKGYTGTGSPRNGYVLYQHDKITTDNTTQYETVSYFTTLTTTYYYTGETDGTVRQWDGPDAAMATEHLNREEFKTEIKATVDVDIYIKPQ